MKLQNLIHIPILIICFGLLPNAQAVSPPPNGGYPGGNTAEGQNALLSRTTGGFNTAVGWFSLESLTTGSFNTGVGAGTLVLNTGDSNTAVGTGAMLLNTSGFGNAAVGTDALVYNDSRSANNAVGAFALFNNTTGSFNTASGFQALYSNTTGFNNTASGADALFNNTTGSLNTATGDSALFDNTTGFQNTATGASALVNNTTGIRNTAVGLNTLPLNTTGNGNTALGSIAGSGVTTADNVIAIDTPGANVSNSCFIGHIRGVTTANADAIPVLIDSAGQLGTISSSRRFKKEIKPMDKTSETILALKPVTFHYKSDAGGTPQFGLIAEEVAEVNPDLVVRDDNGEVYTVRYEAVNVMLLNEFLKEHRKVEQQDRKIQEQERTIAQVKKEVEAVVAHAKQQDAKIQNVSDQIEISRAGAQLAGNDQ